MRHAWILALAALLSSCVAGPASGPIQTPPAHFQSDATVLVEFLPQNQVGRTCANRGAKVFGMSAYFALACANWRLITIGDPCERASSDLYSADLCSALTKKQIKATKYANDGPVRVRVSFVSPDQLIENCALHGLNGPGYACVLPDTILVRNPCQVQKSWYARLLCHELGHVNHWPANHSPIARPLGLRLASQSPEAIQFRQRSKTSVNTAVALDKNE